jgi:GNAT superfamily N-acetyltransferase
MCAEQKIRRMNKIEQNVRVEPVDNWHARWDEVLESLAEQGELEALNIDCDGWLSARQVLLIAFERNAIAGYLCFRLEPAANRAGEVGIDAHLEAFGVREGPQASQIAEALTRAARKRARALRCREIVGFSA